MAKPQKKIAEGTSYTDHYREECFRVWYSAGRPNKKDQVMDIIPGDTHGRTPSYSAIKHWRDEFGWDVRADDLDARANAVVDDEMVNLRVMMLKEQASRGRELQSKGMEHLREHNFDTSASAVNAVIRGAELERTSRGLSERLTKISQLSDDKLIGEVQKLVDKAKMSGEVVEAEVEEDDNSTT